MSKTFHKIVWTEAHEQKLHNLYNKLTNQAPELIKYLDKSTYLIKNNKSKLK